MKTTVAIDEVGRIVIPKSIRESLGIFGRSRVALEVYGGKAELSVADDEPAGVTRKNGRVVCSTTLPDDWDSGEAVNGGREQRLRR